MNGKRQPKRHDGNPRHWTPLQLLPREQTTRRPEIVAETMRHYGIGEDEATGAAAVMMGGLLGRPLEIHQGVGSMLHVRPGLDGTVEVGGRVAAAGTREITDAVAGGAA